MHVSEIYATATAAKQVYEAIRNELELPEFKRILRRSTNGEIELDGCRVLYFADSCFRKGFARILLSDGEEFQIDVEWLNGEISTVKIIEPLISVVRVTMDLEVRYYIEGAYHEEWPLEAVTC